MREMSAAGDTLRSADARAIQICVIGRNPLDGEFIRYLLQEDDMFGFAGQYFAESEFREAVIPSERLVCFLNLDSFGEFELFDIIRHIWEKQPGAAVILYAVVLAPAAALPSLVQSGAYICLEKPLKPELVRWALQSAVQSRGWDDKPGADDMTDGFFPENVEMTDQEKVEEVKKLLQESLQSGRSFSPEEAADLLFISPSHLRRIFRKLEGCSVMDYQKKLRMERAEYLLEMTDLSVKEIAQACGYRETNSFRRVFHETRGKTPTEYREQRLQNLRP